MARKADKQHGGKREGAGRKPSSFPRQVLVVRGTDEEVARIQESLDTRQRVVELLYKEKKMHIKSKTHKADPKYTVHLREVDADYDQDGGFEVAVTKEGFPPHATEFFETKEAAEARFAELTS